MRCRFLPVWIALVAACGCAESQPKTMSTPTGAVMEAPRAAVYSPLTVVERGNMESGNMRAGLVEGQTTIVSILSDGTIAPPKATPRKIIYTADVSIVVEDFPRTADAVKALVASFDGYVADTDVAGATGSHRHASWKVRIPVERFDSFLDSVAKLGELQRRQVHSQDVTEEFFDLETRVKNKKVEEGRLVKHLTESTGKLEEILNVEREISRVREEIERMEGRVRLLANLSDLTTVTITADERIGYVPATAPSFTTRASRTFEGSTKNLTDTVQGLTLAAISVIPWLPVWLIVGVLTWLAFRLIRRLRFFRSSSPRPTVS